MSRWKSPQTAAKHAQRAVKEAEKTRKEKRNGWLLIMACLLVSGGLTTADYFWMQARAAKREEQHRRIFPRQASTNSLASPARSENTNSMTIP